MENNYLFIFGEETRTSLPKDAILNRKTEKLNDFSLMLIKLLIYRDLSNLKALLVAEALSSDTNKTQKIK